MLKTLQSLASSFEMKLKKLSSPMPSDTDELEVIIINTNGSRLSLGKWQWLKIKTICPKLSMLPGVQEIEALFGEITFSWVNGKFSSGFM